MQLFGLLDVSSKLVFCYKQERFFSDFTTATEHTWGVYGCISPLYERIPFNRCFIETLVWMRMRVHELQSGS